jgi:hypothetical protein
MLEGREVFAALLDRHRMHIMEHQSVINDPELRSNPELLANVQAHIQEHIDILRTADPDLLQLIGEQPLAPPQAPQGTPPMPPQGGQGDGGEGGAPPAAAQPIAGQGGSPADMIQPQGDVSQVMGDVQQPRDASVDANLLPNPSIDPRAR